MYITYSISKQKAPKAKSSVKELTSVCGGRQITPMTLVRKLLSCTSAKTYTIFKLDFFFNLRNFKIKLTPCSWSCDGVSHKRHVSISRLRYHCGEQNEENKWILTDCFLAFQSGFSYLARAESFEICWRRPDIGELVEFCEIRLYSQTNANDWNSMRNACKVWRSQYMSKVTCTDCLFEGFRDIKWTLSARVKPLYWFLCTNS